MKSAVETGYLTIPTDTRADRRNLRSASPHSTYQPGARHDVNFRLLAYRVAIVTGTSGSFGAAAFMAVSRASAQVVPAARNEQTDSVLASDEKFDRAKTCACPHWTGPLDEVPNHFKTNGGERGIYGDNPSGHTLEIITCALRRIPVAPRLLAVVAPSRALSPAEATP